MVPRSASAQQPPKDSRQGPTTLLPQHLTEFTEGRGIPAELVRLNIASFGPGTARHWEAERAELLAVRRRQIAEGSLAGNGHVQTQPGHVADRLRRLDQHYAHLEAGGWRTIGAALPGLEAFQQWKPTRPRAAGFGKAKVVKYEGRPGAPTGAFLPNLTTELWRQIAERAGLPPETLLGPDPWGQVAAHPEVEIVWTEGPGKALAIADQGFAALGLPGVWNGRRVTRDADGRLVKEELAKALQAFAAPGRRFTSLFDAESKPKTRHAVEQAALKTGALLQRAGCDVRIARLPLLPGAEKTGADDLLVAQGAESLAQVIKEAEPLSSAVWRHLQATCRRRLQPDQRLQVADLSTAGIERPATAVVGIRSPKGTGKTKLLGAWLQDDPAVLMPTHRISLGAQGAKACGLVWRNDLDAVSSKGAVLRFGPDGERVEGPPSRYSLCCESLLSLASEIETLRGRRLVLVVDEARQLLAHALSSDTLREARALVLEVLRALAAIAEQVILLDADLDDPTLEWFRSARREAGADDGLHLIENHHPSTTWRVNWRTDGTLDRTLADLIAAVKAGERPFVVTDSRERATAIHHALAHAMGLVKAGKVPGERCGGLLVTSETTARPKVRQAMAELTSAEKLGHRALLWVVASPSISTGLSIEHGFFTSVWGFFGGGTYDDADALQAMARVRHPVPRHVWVAPHVTHARPPLSRAWWAGAVERDLERRHRAQRALLAQQRTQQELEPNRLPLLAGVDRERQYGANREAWAAFTAARNASLANLRGFIRARLVAEGHQVVDVGDPGDADRQEQARRIREDRAEQRELREQVGAEEAASAIAIGDGEAAVLRRMETRTAQQDAALRRHSATRALGLAPGAPLTPEDVRWADRHAHQARALGELLDPGLAARRDSARLAAIHATGAGAMAWDERFGLTCARVAEIIGLTHFLRDVVLVGESWDVTHPQVIGLFDACQRHAREVQDALGVAGGTKDTPTALVGRLLGRFGITTIRRQVRQDGGVVSRYQADAGQVERLLAVAERLSHLVLGGNTTEEGVTPQTVCAAIDPGKPGLIAQAPVPSPTAAASTTPGLGTPDPQMPDWIPQLVEALVGCPTCTPADLAGALSLAVEEVASWLGWAQSWLAEGAVCCA